MEMIAESGASSASTSGVELRIMMTFAMLTRLSPDALKDPGTIEDLARRVTGEIERKCPHVRWVVNYAMLGPYDYLDIFEATDEHEAAKVAAIVRSLGHATTETWTLVPWKRYEAVLEVLQEVA
jgi:uncharacterized protein with GYD domain